MLFSYGFLQIVLKPMRCTQHSASLIDHILTNSKSDIFQTAILITKISDYFPLIFMLNDNVKYNNKIIKYRDFSKPNVQKFSASLHSINWDFVESANNTQHSFELFHKTFFALYNLYFPLLSKSCNKNNHGFHP